MSYTDWQAFGAELYRLHDTAGLLPGTEAFQYVSQETLDHYNELSALVPEPAGLGAFALGAFGLLTRRRRQQQRRQQS
ncbi:PEP-CTERM sorting domain-containing protein, partial [Klebsiella pneumoniae]|uniref:PEP-CTERM sorting domain-containing protein n=1 Tax=Klebsiella pneumoniae TaxID=573 RepID=UPI00226F21B6